MGMDYRYLLFFERGACVDALEHLVGMARPGPDEPTSLVLPDRTLPLPFSGWLETGTRIAWDDSSPTWDFQTVLCFEPDEELEDYLDRLHGESGPGADEPGDERHDEHGRAAVGYIDLTVHHDMDDWPSGTDDELVLFEFGTPGSTMSVLFWESPSIRRAFTHLLETCRGVYGLLDMEDIGADLFWLRGSDHDLRLPTAQMPLAEIERLVGNTETVAYSFGADELVAAARHARRMAGGADLGVHHWLLGLLGPKRELPAALDHLDATASERDLRLRLDRGDIGPGLPEGEARREATGLARRAGRDLVTTEDLAQVIADAAGSIDLPPATPSPSADATEDSSPSWWTPRNSTCDPLWRRTLDRVLMSLIYGYGKWIGLALALVVTGVAVGFWVVSTS